MNHIEDLEMTTFDHKLTSEREDVVYELVGDVINGDEEGKQHALESLKVLVDMDIEQVTKFCDSDLLGNLVRPGHHANFIRIVELLNLLLSKLSLPDILLPKLQQALPGHFESENTSLSTAASVVQLYHHHPSLLHDSKETCTELAVSILRLLESLPPPTTANITTFQQDVEQVASLLPLLWASHTEVMQAVMEEIHHLLVMPPDSSFALSATVLLLPLDLVPNILGEPEAPRWKPLRVLSLLVRWLGCWRAQAFPDLVLHLLRLVKKNKWLRMLHRIAVNQAEFMFLALMEPNCRHQLLEVFLFLLYGDQASQKMFGQLIPSIPMVLAALQQEEEMELLAKLQEAATFLAILYPGLEVSPELKQLLPAEGISTPR